MPEDQKPEQAALESIRVETAVSRFPIHRLAKKTGLDEIEIEDGLIEWKVTPNAGVGVPGPLAYKIDTLVVNRKIDEARRLGPVPELLRLGSLGEIAGALDVDDSHPEYIKEALHQNAAAYIRAKAFRYTARGRERARTTVEIGGTRYSAVFKGETLPDGRTSDAVYVVFNPWFRHLLNTAVDRPIDYTLIKGLPAGSHRLYDLLSFSIFAALDNGRPTARLAYGEFCRDAPLTRHVDRDRARKQMHKLALPLVEAAYIGKKVELEEAADRQGRPDWTLTYTPGPRAVAHYESVKGGRKLPPTPTPDGPEAALVERGVKPRMAARLVAEHPPAKIEAKVEQLDWLAKKGGKAAPRDQPALLVASIQEDYAAPKGFVPEADRQALEEERQARHRREVETSRANANEMILDAKAQAIWKARSEPEREAMVQQALAAASQAEREAYDKVMSDMVLPESSRRASRTVLCLGFIKAGLAAGATV